MFFCHFRWKDEVAELVVSHSSHTHALSLPYLRIFDQTSDYCKKFFYFKTAEAMGAVRKYVHFSESIGLTVLRKGD